MRLVGGLIAAAIAGLAVGYGYEIGRDRPPTPVDARLPALAPDDAARFGAVEPLGVEVGHDFDLIVPLRRNVHDSVPGFPVSPQDAVRLFFDLADANNYLAAELSDDGVTFLAVEEGVRMDLARVGRASAAANAGVDNLSAWNGMPDDAEIRLRRRWPNMELLVDGRTALRSAHEGFARGTAAAAATPGREIGPVRFQPATPIYFADDFMRMPEEVDAWRQTQGARWEVRGMDNPAKSANAFVYQGNAAAWSDSDPDRAGIAEAPRSVQGGASLTGEDWWSGYRAEVSALGVEDGLFGLVLAAGVPVDPDGAAGDAQAGWPERCAVARWSPNAKDAPGELQILRVRDGREEVLARAPGGFVPGRWYRLSADLADGVVRVSIDGRELLEAADPAFSGGLAGLHVSGSSAEFDDFIVVSREANGSARDFRPGRMAWRFHGGDWDAAGRALAGGGSSNSSTPAIAVVGTRRLENARVVGTARPSSATGLFGLAACFTGPGDCLALEYDRIAKVKRLVRYRAGAAETLDSSPWTPPAGGEETAMELIVDRGAVEADSLCALLPDLEPGRAGVIVAGARTVFQEFSAIGLDAPLPLVSRNKVFDDEEQMALWSGEAGDWIVQQIARRAPDDKAASDAGMVFDRQHWHRGVFFGNTEMEADWPKTAAGAATLALSLAKPWRGGDEAVNGYYLVLESPAPEAGVDAGRRAGRLQLKRGAAVAAEMEWKTGEREWPSRVRLRKAGAWVAAYLDGAQALAWRDPEPLSGPKAAWAAKGLALDGTAVRMVSRTARDYSFNDAPADFRVGGGVWEVANRWECDPRWAFFTGMTPAVVKSRIQYFASNAQVRESRWKAAALRRLLEESPDPEGRLVALWHKRPLLGDQAIETFLAQMMFQGSNYASFVKNFCMALCGDGRDVSSGYAFVFGGWNNTKSAILKNGVIVAESQNEIPAGGDIHRRWFRLRAEKRGDTVTFAAFTQNRRGENEYALINNGQLSYTDPDPLAGGQAALWSYDSPICIARLRLGAESWGPAEDALAPDPGASTVFYDRRTADE